MVSAWRLVGVTLWAALSEPLPRALGAACTHVVLQAEHGHCDDRGCTLRGDAQLRCGERWLRADELRVQRGPDGAFDGAQARGCVRYVDGQQLLTAEALVLGADQIQGEVHAATLVQFADVAADQTLAAAAAAGTALPRRALRVDGASLLRGADGAWQAHDAALTLCDCGAAPPSWTLQAAKVTLDAGQTRATAFWPVVRLHLWPRRTVPVTPPLLPISVPLSRRAVGLLPPRLQFLGPRAPVVDVPLFVPLGPSWDATLSFGVRPDWAGSPRFGGRVRGAPRAGVEVADAWMLTYDRRAPHARLGSGTPASWAADAGWRDARGALATRILWTHRHVAWLRGPPAHRPGVRARLLDGLRLHAEGQLASDNEVPRAFAVAPAERAAAYLPSRLWLQAGDARQSLALQGTFLQRLEATGALHDGSLVPFAAGLRASSAGTVQRPLALRWQLAALPLGHGASLDAAASWAWLVPLPRTPEGGATPLVAPQDPLSGPVHLVGATFGAGWRRPLGPFRLGARAAVDAVAHLGGGGTGTLASPLGQLRGALPLARRGAGGVHTFEPRLEVLGVAAYTGNVGSTAASSSAAQLARYDERLWREGLLQGALGLRRAFRGDGGRAWRLDVVAPVDLRRGVPLRPALDAEASWAGGAALVWLGVAPEALGRGAVAAGLQDVAIDARHAFGRASFAASYVRLSPRAERLQRTAYALAAPGAPRAGWALGDAGADSWQHTLVLTLGREAAIGLGARYQAGVQLPRPNPATLGVEPACTPRGGGRGRRACLTAHSAAISYASPCHCWRADAVLSAAPRDFWGTFRFLVTLDVAGYRLGTPG